MKLRGARLGPDVFAVAALSVILLLAGCGSGNTISATASVNSGTHTATITYRTHGGPDIVLLFLTYPDGHSEQAVRGAGGAGGSFSPQLPSGTYTYTIYWVAEGKQDPESVSAQTIIKAGHAVSGKFSIP